MSTEMAAQLSIAPASDTSSDTSSESAPAPKPTFDICKRSSFDELDYDGGISIKLRTDNNNKCNTKDRNSDDCSDSNSNSKSNSSSSNAQNKTWTNVGHIWRREVVPPPSSSASTGSSKGTLRTAAASVSSGATNNLATDSVTVASETQSVLSTGDCDGNYIYGVKLECVQHLYSRKDTSKGKYRSEYNL